MHALLIAAIGLLGLIIGVLVNVVVDRVPRRESLAKPRLRCEACGAQRSLRDSIPVLSWWGARRLCGACGTRFPARYVVTEGITCTMWALLASWSMADPARLAMLPTLLVVSAACVALWQIDVVHHRLPNAIVYALYPITALGIIAAGLSVGSWPLAAILGSIAVWTAVFAGLHMVTRGRGMGMGDVKLAPVLGATLGWFGWGASVLGLMAAFIIGGVTGVALLIARQRTRHQAIAFGPFMITGVAVGMLLGSAAAQWYLAAG